MRIRKGLKVRSIGGESIILLQGTYGVDSTRILSLNETSLFLWNLYSGKEFTTEQIITSLMQEFSINRSLATKDANAWINVLVQNRLIEQP